MRETGRLKTDKYNWKILEQGWANFTSAARGVRLVIWNRQCKGCFISSSLFWSLSRRSK